MLSQTAEYALRAVVLLAERADGGSARVGELADALGIPQNYLSKTLHLLVRAGVLASTRGKGGGFRLARPAEEIALLDVVDPFDRMGHRPVCLMGQGECSEAHACAAHASWKEVSARVQAFFQQTTVGDLARSRKPAPKRTARARAKVG
ncbi:MAG TPA: Rrf2 family transcriptional regulator [Gemmatimonadales bacterium]|jgi:Rrf2 family protein|nr:Rrf2 family transcriptional regulator [Gemmatimonadales bacterium]